MAVRLSRLRSCSKRAKSESKRKTKREDRRRRDWGDEAVRNEGDQLGMALSHIPQPRFLAEFNGEN
jgi:hypothetical protein